MSINTNMEENSKYIVDPIVLYSNSVSNDYMLELKKGYEFMGEFNLKYSEIGNEYLLDNIDEYEAWISGV